MNDPLMTIIQQVISAWASQNKLVTQFFNQYPEADYEKEVAPGRNRAIYLLGHLVAVNDGMIPLFDKGDRLFPQLETPFLKQPDKASNEFPPIAELKNQWEVLNNTLAKHFDEMTASEWMDRHTAVSEADFALNPRRNKMNVLISRINHQSYHLGQLILLKP